MRVAASIPGVLMRIGKGALWAPLAIVLVHWSAGDWLGHEPYVDPVMHFSGGVAAAFFFWRSAEYARSYLGAPTAITLGLLAFGLATFAAVAWEFGEFLLDLAQHGSRQRGLANTMRDLFLGISGALVFSGAAVWYRLRDRIGPDE